MDIELPLEVSPQPGVKLSLSRHEDERLRVVVHRSVDSSRLEVVLEGSGWSKPGPAGGRIPLPRLRVTGGTPSERSIVDDFVGALTFLTDVPISLSRPPLEDAFVAETVDEAEFLKDVGTDQPFHETGVQGSIRTFNPVVNADAVMALFDRAPGIRLYANARQLRHPVAQFRELWRVLESAFAAQDERLTRALVEYRPALQLGFDCAELEALRTLRGRASHAQARAEVGKQELIDVDRECSKALPRLKNLVERVILTKKSWGYGTGGIRELAPVQSFIRSDGGMVLIKHPTPLDTQN